MSEHPYYEQDFANIDFRQHPELYRVGKGEQGVLLVEPYKSESYPIGVLKRQRSRNFPLTRSTICFCNINSNMISWGWIWRASTYRWDSPVPVVMPITKAAASMARMGKNCPVMKTA